MRLPRVTHYSTLPKLLIYAEGRLSTLVISLVASANTNIMQRWDDDVIFKNQARGTEDKGKKEFVNVRLAAQTDLSSPPS